MKSGNHIKLPHPPTHPTFNYVCNHRNTLETFSSVFGEASLIPRLFDKKAFKNGSILDDMLSVIGLPEDSSYVIPPNANESLSATGIHLLRRLNQLVPTWIDNKPNPARANLVTYFEKYFSDNKYVMPKYLYEE